MFWAAMIGACCSWVAAVEPSTVATREGGCAWQSGFHSEGPSGSIWAALTFDDGSGPALYAAGAFQTIGDQQIQLVGRWDGSTWSAVGNELEGTVVLDLEIFDAGTGPALYAIGSFEIGGEYSALAKWDGKAWSTVGGGIWYTGYALEVFDDGAGEALYIGGQILSVGSQSVNHVAKWDGASWTALGAGVELSSIVHDLLVFDDGGGPDLYVAGSFESAGGIPALGIARWDGSAWSSVGSAFNRGVRALAVFDDGSGPALYAGGAFTSDGSEEVLHIGRWDGADWHPVGGGMDNKVSSLMVHDFGQGARLWAGGSFRQAGGQEANGLAAWDGSQWQALGAGVDTGVLTLTPFDDGSGEKLIAGGWFTKADHQPAPRIASWDGVSWSSLSSSSGGDGVSAPVRVSTVYDDGNGPAVYAGGDFALAGNEVVGKIARWDGSDWQPLGGGIDGDVRALEVFDSGSGAELYVGGEFIKAGHVAAANVARWNGSSWMPLGAGLNAKAQAMETFDDGSGAALYVLGDFDTVAGQSAPLIARWDGTAWSMVGTGLTGVSGTALEVYDDGSGPALYVAGFFEAAGGQPAKGIAKWDGTVWAPVGTGDPSQTVEGAIFSLKAFDDGTGPVLVAGGDFMSVDGIDVGNVAKWNGTQWAAMGQWPRSRGQDNLEVFNDGSGLKLCGVGMTEIRNTEVYRVTCWDGSQWQPLPDLELNLSIQSLTAFGSSLFVGGSFSATHDGVSTYFGEYSCAGTWIFADGFESGDVSTWSLSSP